MAENIYKQKNEQEKPSLEIVRTADEIIQRIRMLEEEIKRNDILLHKGNGQVQEPTAKRRQNILRGKLLEWKWLLGQDVEIEDGVY